MAIILVGHLGILTIMNVIHVQEQLLIQIIISAKM